MPVDGIDCLCPEAADRTIQACTEHGIDDEIGLVRQAVENLCAHTSLETALGILSGELGHATRIAELQDAYVETLFPRKPGDHVAVATVIASSAKKGDITGIGPLLANHLVGVGPCPFHERFTGDTEGFDGVQLHGPDLPGPVKRERQTVDGR